MRFTPFYKQPHLQKIFEEHKQWGGVIDIRSIADLNQAVAEQRIAPIIQMCEVQQDKKLSQIADQIAHAKPTPRFVLVAGPSSSGKTTFSKRLELHLRVNGLSAVRIEVDNYFHDRAQTPRDPSNKIDFEHIEAVDLVMLNAHLRALEEGKEVELPTFNFKQGVKEFRGQRLRLEAGQVVILEGIHCLNPRLTEHVAEEHKFKVYVSALTQLMLDHNNLISTTDLRLLRRMVRDYRTRGKSALTHPAAVARRARGRTTLDLPLSERGRRGLQLGAGLRTRGAQDLRPAAALGSETLRPRIRRRPPVAGVSGTRQLDLRGTRAANLADPRIHRRQRLRVRVMGHWSLVTGHWSLVKMKK